MKVGKIWIAMILVALGFQVNAQRAAYVHESYNSVRKYIRPLQLSQNQVVNWSRLNETTNIAISDIERSRGLSPRSKARRIESIQDRHDRSLARILSRRQLERFINLSGARNVRSNNINNNAYCPSPYDAPRDQRNGNQFNDRNRDGNQFDDRDRIDNRDTGNFDDTSNSNGARRIRS